MDTLRIHTWITWDTQKPTTDVIKQRCCCNVGAERLPRFLRLRSRTSFRRFPCTLGPPLVFPSDDQESLFSTSLRATKERWGYFPSSGKHLLAFPNSSQIYPDDAYEITFIIHQLQNSPPWKMGAPPSDSIITSETFQNSNAVELVRQGFIFGYFTKHLCNLSLDFSCQCVSIYVSCFVLVPDVGDLVVLPVR